MMKFADVGSFLTLMLKLAVEEVQAQQVREMVNYLSCRRQMLLKLSDSEVF